MKSSEAPRHLPIEELDVFAYFEKVADRTWEIVNAWLYRHFDTLGKQLTRSVDSINSNLVEGGGRYSLPDSLHFSIISRASAREARLWINRAKKRNLMEGALAEALIADLVQGTKLLNLLINYRRQAKGNLVKESTAEYKVSGNLDVFHKIPNTINWQAPPKHRKVVKP